MEKLRVFIVDDSGVARQMLSNILSADEGIEIVGDAGSGQGAIIMLEEAYPDIILLEADIGGGMSLEEIIGEIHNFNPAIKVILCVENYTQEKALAAVKSDTYDIVKKPYDPKPLLRVLKNTR